MSGYVLTPTAQEDLAGIRDYYLDEAGYRIARQMHVEFVEAFRFLARAPGAGHKREDPLGAAGIYQASLADAGFE
jgi:plasmid stabilization system protein ParE